MTETNPNDANQYNLDPRQNICWNYYINPESATFSNAKQSAIRAGYEESSAEQITTREWFIAKTRRMNMLNKAEKVLEMTLEIDHMVPKIGMFGPIKDPETKERVFQVDSQILKIKQDSAKFVGERLGKNDGYSTRNEITGANGEKLIPEPSEEIKRLTQKLLAIQTPNDEDEQPTDTGSDGGSTESMGSEISD